MSVAGHKLSVGMFRVNDDDRVILRLAVPAFGALAAEPLVALVDTAFVGRLGEEPLAALGVVTSLLGLAFFVFVALAYASTPLLARAIGEGNHSRAEVLTGQVLMIALMLVVIGVVVFETAPTGLVRLMGADPEVEALAVSYLRIRGLGLPGILAVTVGHAIYRGVGDTRTPMFVSLGLSLVNAILDAVFIHWFGWGLAGAGFASVIAQSSGGAILVYLILAGRTGLTVRWTAPRVREMSALIGAGSALFVRTFALVATFTVSTSAAARLGVTEVAAHHVAIQIWSLLYMVVDSVAIAAQHLVATHLPSHRETAARLARRMLAWGVIWGIMLAVIFWALRYELPGWLTHEPSVVILASSLMPFVAVSQPLNSVVFVLDGIMIGAADFRFLAVAMIGASLLTNVMLVSAGSLNGIWWAIMTLMVARFVPLGWRYLRIMAD